MLPCVLGCSVVSDSLNHYVNCPHMYAFQNYLFEGCSSDPLIRFGIKHPESQNLKVLSCLFSAYHALKADIRAGKINVLQSSLVWLNASWSVFANAIKAEAGEMQLATRSFSLPKWDPLSSHLC